LFNLKLAHSGDVVVIMSTALGAAIRIAVGEDGFGLAVLAY
jgi:hypothetical protein